MIDATAPGRATPWDCSGAMRGSDGVRFTYMRQNAEECEECKLERKRGGVEREREGGREGGSTLWCLVVRIDEYVEN